MNERTKRSKTSTKGDVEEWQRHKARQAKTTEQKALLEYQASWYANDEEEKKGEEKKEEVSAAETCLRTIFSFLEEEDREKLRDYYCTVRSGSLFPISKAEKSEDSADAAPETKLTDIKREIIR